MCSRLAASAFAVMLAWPTAVSAQMDVPHDADVIDNLYRGNFEAIGRTRAALIDVLVVQGSLTDTECEFDYQEPDPEVAGEARTVFAFIADLSRRDPGVLFVAGGTRAVHPLYLRTAQWVDTGGGCSGERAWTLQRNVVKLLAARSRGDGWGLGEAAAERAEQARRQREQELQTAKARLGLTPGGVATNEELAAWRTQCEGARGLPGNSRDVRARWCYCAAGWLRTGTAEERASMLTDHGRTTEEIRTKRPWVADGLGRCTVPDSPRRR